MSRTDAFFADSIPKKFCREFIELRGHSGMIVNYMALVLEIKPLLDDWIQADRIEDYIKLCEERYGLHVTTGAVWLEEASDEYLHSLPEGESLTTTKFTGAPYEKGTAGGRVHVLVSKSKVGICVY